MNIRGFLSKGKSFSDTLFCKLIKDKSFQVNIFLDRHNLPKRGNCFKEETFHDRTIAVSQGTDHEYRLN